MSATPAVELRNITTYFPGVTANDNANLQAYAGEVHAVLGENGAGKSTLMRTLYGAQIPASGCVSIAGREAHFPNPRTAIAAGIGMINQEFMLVRSMSVVENIILGLPKSGMLLDIDAAAEKIQQLAESSGLYIDPNAIVAELPVGMQQRVEILKLLYREAKILILDEPTAVLTTQETQKLLATLRTLADKGCTLLIVTHKLTEVMQVADRVTVMRDGCTLGTHAVSETNEKELARLMVGREVVMAIDKPAAKPGAEVLQVTNLKVSGNAGENIHNLNLTVSKGEIVGIAGVDGNGQTALIEAITGLRSPTSGTLSINGIDITGETVYQRSQRGLAYVPADRRHVGSVQSLTIEENAVLGQQRKFTRLKGLLVNRLARRQQAQSIVQNYSVKTPHLKFPAGNLSGGNLQKLILGRALINTPQLLVIEQPTRGLDVGAIEYVWQAILAVRAEGKAVLLVSAELSEIKSLADRILVLHAGHLMGELAADQADDETLGLMMAGVQLDDSRANQAGGPNPC